MTSASPEQALKQHESECDENSAADFCPAQESPLKSYWTVLHLDK